MTLTSGTRVSTFLPPGRLDCPRKFLLSAFWSLQFHLKEHVSVQTSVALFSSDFFTDPDGLRAAQEGNSSSKVQISHF